MLRRYGHVSEIRLPLWGRRPRLRRTPGPAADLKNKADEGVGCGPVDRPTLAIGQRTLEAPRYGTIMLALASLFPLVSSRAADTKFVKAVSDHFELYTTDNQAAAKAALTHFETVRGYLLRAINAEDPFAAPVRIVGFKSPGEYGPYIPRNGDLSSKAFSIADPERVTIVMSSLKPETYQYGVHEYVSLVFARVAPKMPYWLRLGFSELYSTLHTTNGQLMRGSEPAREFRSAVSADFNMEVMFSLKGGVSRNKAAADFYAETSQTGVANSKTGAAMANLASTQGVDYPVILWQLTHMLMFKKEYSPKFGAFVGAVSGGEDTVAAVLRVFGQSLAGLQQDLTLYIKMPAHAVVGLNFQLDKPVAPRMSQLSAGDSAFILEDLKAAK